MEGWRERKKKRRKAFCQIQKHYFALRKVTELGGPRIGGFVLVSPKLKEDQIAKNHLIIYFISQNACCVVTTNQYPLHKK